MEQLYAIQIDNCKYHKGMAEYYLQSGRQFSLHSGGRGNGAQGGLYTKGQLNRIIGKYPEGVAKAIPVAFGQTQLQADQLAEMNARNAFWVDCLDEVGIPMDIRGKARSLFLSKENPYA